MQRFHKSNECSLGSKPLEPSDRMNMKHARMSEACKLKRAWYSKEEFQSIFKPSTSTTRCTLLLVLLLEES